MRLLQHACPLCPQSTKCVCVCVCVCGGGGGGGGGGHVPQCPPVSFTYEAISIRAVFTIYTYIATSLLFVCLFFVVVVIFSNL